MATMMETSTLVAGRLVGSALPPHRLICRLNLVGLVAGLAIINAIGAYGFLAKAHIDHALAGDLAVSGRAADIDAGISVQADKVADLSKQIADLDAARTIEPPATGTLRTAAAIDAQAAALAAAAKLRAADDERRQAKRTELAVHYIEEGKALATLKVEKAGIDGERRTV